MNADNSPDLFELQDWAVLYAPELWAAVRYLHAGPLYAALFAAWSNAHEC